MFAHKNPKQASKQADTASDSGLLGKALGKWPSFADFQISFNLCRKLITLNYLGPFQTNEVHLSESRLRRLSVATVRATDDEESGTSSHQASYRGKNWGESNLHLARFLTAGWSRKYIFLLREENQQRWEGSKSW